MSSSPLPPPPEYAPVPWLLGPPLYSQDASSSEVLVEASQPPPAYPNTNITRTNTSSTATTTHSNVSRARDTVDYRYRSGNIEISLGPKVPGFDIASYGKGGIVRGTVTLKKLTWVESVVINVCPSYPVVSDVYPDSPCLQLDGIAQTAITQNGMPLGRSFKPILNLRQVLYTKAKDQPRPAAPQSYPFEFVLPTSVQNSNEPLPPTFRAVQPLMESNVRYQVLVQVVKASLLPNEK